MQRIINALNSHKITIKSIAHALRVSPDAIYSRLKRQKIDGNKDWVAFEKYLKVRMSIIEYPCEFSELLREAMHQVEVAKEKDRRHRKITLPKKCLIVDGKTYPLRRFKGYEYASSKLREEYGSLFVAFRNDPKIYKIIMQTLTHTVMYAVDKQGKRANELLYCYSNATLNARGLGVEKMARKVAEYFGAGE